MGSIFDNMQAQISFRVVLKKRTCKIKGLTLLFLTTLWKVMPASFKPHALTFTTKTDYMGLSRFGVAIVIFQQGCYCEDNYDLCKADGAMYEQFSSAGHKIGG